MSSAFFQTELDLILRRLDVRTVILAGTTTPNCVRTTWKFVGGQHFLPDGGGEIPDRPGAVGGEGGVISL